MHGHAQRETLSLRMGTMSLLAAGVGEAEAVAQAQLTDTVVVPVRRMGDRIDCVSGETSPLAVVVGKIFAVISVHLWLDLLRQSTVVLSPQGVPQYHKYHTAPLTVPFLKLMGMTIWTVGLQTRLVAVPFRS